jgi:hypothetical protein
MTNFEFAEPTIWCRLHGERRFNNVYSLVAADGLVAGESYSGQLRRHVEATWAA